MTAALRLKQISKSYPDGHEQRQILDQIDLTVNKGEVVAILGPSGSGKSTLLSIIGHLLSADEGEVFLGDLNTSTTKPAEWTRIRRKEIGFIFQSHHLLPYLTITDQLLQVARLTKQSAAKEEVARFLAELDLTDCANKYPKDMSGGQKQRAAIARAFITKPQLILADEPTASLDEARGRQVVQLLRNEAKERQTAAIIVTHDERILDLVDQIYDLKDCKLIARN